MKASRNFPLVPRIFFCLLSFIGFLSLSVCAQSGAVRPRTSTITTSPSAQPLPEAQFPKGDTTLKGRVVYQDNQQPLKGVRIRIFTAAGVERPLIAVSNNRGEFQLEKLGPGKYYATVEGGVATPSGMGMRLPLPISAIPRREDFEEIVPRHDAEFTADGTNPVMLEIRLKRGGTVSGRVFKADGSPAENVMVNLVSREGGDVSQFTVRSEKNGVFRINNIPAADYLVAASVEQNPAGLDIRARMRGEARVVTYHPAATSVADAALVQVLPGQETSSINITLVSRNAYEVSGTVISQRDGTPIVGATVLLRSKNPETSGIVMPGTGQRTTHTDTQGNWSFASVVEGDYLLVALSPIARPQRPGAGDRESAFRASRQKFLVKQQDITVSGSNLQGLALAISGSGSIRGRVETDDGTALPNDLVIFLESVTENNRPSPPLPVRVAADGYFSFSDIQAGEVFISAAFPSGSKYIVESVMASGNNLKHAPLRVVEGADSEPVSIKVSTGLATVEGRVLAKTGEGLGDWVVLIVPAHASEQRFRTSLLSVRTAPNGFFRVSGVPGEYLIFARKRDELPGLLTPEFFQKGVPDAERITLKRGEQTFDLRVEAQ